MFTAIIPILCNINPCMLFLLSIEKKTKKKTITSTLALISGLIFLDPALQNSCYLNLMSSSDR